MSCPVENVLPPPPPDKTGWPWTGGVECPAGAGEWPTISIVVPTYNHAPYIEETLRSILLQGYPSLELIVIDGGSTDGSVEIIRKYEPWITCWVSEKDRGQTHAINKGMAKATGQIRAYLNSDDIYLPGTLQAVAEYSLTHPEADLIYGRCAVVNEAGQQIDQRVGDISSVAEILDLWGVWWRRKNFVQPEVFWMERIANRIGPFREDLHYVMDYEYWLRIFLAGGKSGRIDRDLAAFRILPSQKSTNARGAADELRAVVQPFLWDENVPLTWMERLRMQAKWLYDAKFLAAVKDAVDMGDGRLTRWVKLLTVLVRNPKIFAGPGIYTRAATVMRSKLGQA